MSRLARFPFFVILMGLAGLAMLPPAIMAAQSGLFASARAFFYSGALLLMLTVMLAMALSGFCPKNVARSHLLTLVGAYLGLPAVFAVPFHQAVGDTTWLNAYFEMVSSFTTTGASVFAPDRLDGSMHLWRAEVGWLGGLFVWITAAAIFAPLNLGGFEVSATSEPGRGVASASDGGSTAETTTQLIRVTVQLLPVYAGLTLVLWVCLIIAGDTSLVAVVHAMSTLSTSGISPGGGLANAPSSGLGEALIFLFLIFALSRRAYATEAALRTSARLVDDPEMRLGALLVLAVSAALFLRHFIGAGEFGLETEAARQSAAGALWGTLFTVLSFLTTTGFVSENWAQARGWSGLETPGLVLVGLALIGGGVATTAGGVKLLRVYALYIHGRRELGRLVHPSLVAATGKRARAVPVRGVYIAWVFFMLFALSVAAIWVALAAAGIGFDHAMILTVASLSTTGPLAPVATEGAVSWGALGSISKWILMGAMILGRLETLAIIALLNREFWSR